MVGKLSPKFSTTSLRVDAYLLLRELTKRHMTSHINFLSNLIRALSLFQQSDIDMLVKLGDMVKAFSPETIDTPTTTIEPLKLPTYRVISETRYLQLIQIEEFYSKGF